MEVIVFDICAPFGQFRVPYTTTSPITYPIPPKTSIAGMVGAIIGLDKNNYLNFFQEDSFLISVALLNPVKKIFINENFINTKVVSASQCFARMKAGKSNRTQITVEFLKDPRYRIFFSHGNLEIISKLESFLTSHKSYYTLVMGLSECVANYSYVGTFEVHEIICEEMVDIELDSVLPLDSQKDMRLNFDLIEGRKFLKVHLPVLLSPERELLKSIDLLIEQDGKTIPLKTKYYFEINELKTKILFF